jgi:hypothetical protein
MLIYLVIKDVGRGPTSFCVYFGIVRPTLSDKQDCAGKNLAGVTLCYFRKE